VADNIYVAPGVTELYGTYIAREAFHTCGKIQNTSLTGILKFGANQTFVNGETTCYKQLTINGAVISQGTLHLNRIFGGQNDNGQKITDPSEIFQYTPAVYLAPYERTRSTTYDNWKTTSQKVLPARL
jgi:hypothetical protein